MKRTIEICANSAQSCVEAELGGATRVELCASIPEGGTTPSYGEIKTAQALTSTLKIHVIIRPRGGDFLYTPAEIQSMLQDIELCKQLKVQGVVVGCLTREGDIDVALLDTLVKAAQPLSVTFHRAFDVCRDPFVALEQIIAAGCDRILTSGQQPTAEKGIPLIAELVKRAAGRIIIMPGCGVREDNIERLEAETGAKEFHTSARSIVYSRMEYRNENVPMGSSAVSSEFETVETDHKKVMQIVTSRS
ncbi:copper homeostasis protein CutC [Parabacteroides sp. 52]|uniref:copper homeostasis protein CutC n=1 Tax=unclassified Parabacteroides TaxID=2649774 RepID=UPI0013D14A42|nr:MULTISPECIES: copper homeostasis protein CutC [unclassified Parabacteroides]MDH6534475.1 copper homeostasis protein [Parabacteroides sp. PM5-20]NDV55075.1 copper homeostasis protein CutC [Parabacteroides sp. 52]